MLKDAFRKNRTQSSPDPGEKELLEIFGEKDHPYIKLQKLAEYLNRHPEVKKKVLHLLKRILPPEASTNPFYQEIFRELEKKR